MSDFDFQIDDETFKKQLQKLFIGLDKLSKECKSQTVSELIKACSYSIYKYSDNLDVFTSLYNQFEATYKSKYSALEENIDSHYKIFESIKEENSKDIMPESALKNMEQELSHIRDTIRKKDQLDQLNDTVIELVKKAHKVNSEIRNEVAKIATVSFLPIFSDEARKLIVGEIAKEFDLTFILKAKSLAERFKNASEKIIIDVIEADNSLHNWEEFTDNLSNLNKKINALNSEMQLFVK